MASTSTSPPPANERPKKVSRPGGLNMSDLAKRFEEKPSSTSAEKKSTNRVITPLKVSDARRAFESKADSQTPSPLRKGSIGSGGESLPTSPSRTSRSGSVSSANSGSAPISKSNSTNKAESKEEDRPTKSVTSSSKITEKERETSPKKVLKSLSKEHPKKEKTPPLTTYSTKREKTPVVENKKEKSPVKDKENVRPSLAKKADTPSEPLKKIENRIQPNDKSISKPTPRTKETTLPKSRAEAAIINEPSIKSPEVSNVPEEARTRQIPIRVDSSESSDSESEAEKLLRLLSEKREKLEMAKAEKLRKVSETNREPIKVDMPAIKEESRTPTPARHVERTIQQEPSTDMKFATLPRGFKNKATERPSLVTSSSRTSSMDDTRSAPDTTRKKTEMEIVLNQKPRGAASNRSSYAEIHIASPTSKEPPRTTEIRQEVERPIGVSSDRRFSGGESQLQRARRERIIPIMIEDDDEDDRSSSISESRTTSSSMSSSGRSGFGPPPTTQQRTEHLRNQNQKSAPENIQKSRRERIIPIAVEGEGLVTPSIDETASESSRTPFQKHMGHASTFNRGRGFFMDRSESFSSAGEEEDEDEEDGFQILTAESLFSTLLSRVRSLTRKMGTDDPRVDRLRRISPGDAGSPFSPLGVGATGGTQGPNAGFWSSLYSGDSPAKRISESFAQGSQTREDDPFGHFASPLFNRTLSRDPSDADSVFSEPSFSTLPRAGLFRPSILPTPKLLRDPFFDLRPRI